MNTVIATNKVETVVKPKKLTALVSEKQSSCNNNTNLYNKSGYVCLSVCHDLCSVWPAKRPIETKLDTRTHVHPGSVSGKVNVKVIRVCVRD